MSTINESSFNDQEPLAGDYRDNTSNETSNPDEMPEKHVSEHESLEYPAEKEFTQQDQGNDASYSEQTDVTPPRTKEFPSVGNVKTDFAARPHGRTTGRMVGHEPGTEGI